MKDTNEFLLLRIEALEKALAEAHKKINEINEVCTQKAKNISVIINDPNFDKPLNQLKK